MPDLQYAKFALKRRISDNDHHTVEDMHQSITDCICRRCFVHCSPVCSSIKNRLVDHSSSLLRYGRLLLLCTLRNLTHHGYGGKNVERCRTVIISVNCRFIIVFLERNVLLLFSKQNQLMIEWDLPITEHLVHSITVLLDTVTNRGDNRQNYCMGSGSRVDTFV